MRLPMPWKTKSAEVDAAVTSALRLREMQEDADRKYDQAMAMHHLMTEEKTFDWGYYQMITQGPSAKMFAGEYMMAPSRRIVKALHGMEPWVNSCTNAIAKQFQNCNYILKLRKSTDGKKQTIASHPFLDFMNNAGSDVEQPALFTSVSVMDMILTGDAFFYISPDLKSKRRLMSEQTDVVITDNRITSYRILDKASGLPKMDLEPKEVVHVRLPNPFSPHVGLPMFIALMLPVLIEKYGMEFIVGFFLRGGQTAGIIETDTTDMDRLLRLAKTLMQAIGGRKNMHADKILPKGSSWKTNGHNFGEMRLMELMKHNIGHFRAATGCTNTVLGIAENVNRATALAELELFWKSTILPMQKLWCAAIKASPLWWRFGMSNEYDLAFDNSEVEWIDDFDRRLEQDGKLAPVMTVNERRERLGLKTIERLGDKFATETAAPVAAPQGPSLSGADAAALPPAPGGAAAEGGEEAAAAAAAQNAYTAPTVSLNGAQVTALLDILNRVATGQIPRDSGVAAIMVAFAIDKPTAESLMGSIGNGFTPAAQPSAIGAPPPRDDDDEEEDDDGDDDPPPPPKGGKKSFTLGQWKSLEEAALNPGQKMWNVFRAEFGVWQSIILRNLTDRKGAEAEIADRAEHFGEAFALSVLDTAMDAYDRQLRIANDMAGKGDGGLFTVEKAVEADRKLKLQKLRERARQVMAGDLKGLASGKFADYSKTATQYIYDLIEAGLEENRSLTDIAAQVRMAFQESYGQGEVATGRAETIVRTEVGTAVSMAQRQFGEDLGTVVDVMEKAWVSIGDDGHTRETHLDNEANPLSGAPDEVLDAKWANGLRYPRDPEGEAHEVINCRCSIQYRPLRWKPQ